MTVIIDWVDAAPCGRGETIIMFPGALELPCGHQDPRAGRQLGSPWRTEPMCSFRGKKPPQKRGRGLRVTAGLTDRQTCESLRPRNPSLLPTPPGNGITVFTPGEAVPNAH